MPAQTARTLVDFCSNDYLGLARHPALAAAHERVRRGAAAPAAAPRTWSPATAPSTQRLEEELAAFTGRERALLFSTGYMANLGS